MGCFDYGNYNENHATPGTFSLRIFCTHRVQLFFYSQIRIVISYLVNDDQH